MRFKRYFLTIFLNICLIAEPGASSGASEIALLSQFSLEELMEIEVSSSAFFAQKPERAVGSVQQFHHQDIEASAVRNLGDLVDSRVIGMTFGMHGGNGALVGNRGVMIDNNAKTLVMLEGQQLNNRSHAFGDYFMMPFLADMDRVEVSTSPGAVVHGSGAISGFINLIPKNGKDDAGFEGHVEYGTFEELKKAEMGYGISYGEQKDLYLYAGILEAAGNDGVDDIWSGKDPVLAGNGEKIDAYGFRRSNYRVSAYLRHNGFKLNTLFLQHNPVTHSTWGGRYLFHHGMFSIRPQYTWQLGKRNSLELLLATELHDVGLESTGSREAHYEAKTIFRTTFFDNHQLALGALSGHRDFKEKAQYFSGDYPDNYPVFSGQWTELGLFAEDVISFGGPVLSLGLRYDTMVDNRHVVDDAGTVYDVPVTGHWSPRIALSHEPVPGTVLKASWQHGFRYPDANYYNTTKLVNDAVAGLGLEGRLPHLRPEQMDSFELTLHQEIPAARLSLDVNLFYNIYEDQLFYSGLEGYLPEQTLNHPSLNTGAVVNGRETTETWGSELMVHWDPLDWMRVRCGYGYVDTHEFEVERYQAHQVKTNLKFMPFKGRLTIDVNGAWNSRLPAGEMRHWAYEKDRFVFDAAALYRISSHWSVRAVAKNLFRNDVPSTGYDIHDPLHGHLGENGRRIYVTLSCRF